MKVKTVYETFTELAGAMVGDEGGLLHSRNCALNKNVADPCHAWQLGVRSFAEWLDHIGCKVEISDEADDFYNYKCKE